MSGQLLACLTSGATGSCFISASDGRWSPSCSAGQVSAASAALSSHTARSTKYS